MALGVVVVGCGARGRIWAEVIDRMGGEVMLTGAVDENYGHARALADPRGVPAFEDVEEALESVMADAVLVVTPPATHRAVIERVLHYGRPVLAEKPLADNLGDAVALVRQAEGAGVPLSLSVQFRYLPVSRRLRELLASQPYGRPGFAQFTYLRNRDPYALHLNWGTRYPVTARHPMLLDQTIHHFDLIRFCYQAEPVWIQANTWNPSWSLYAHDSNVAAFMELTNGVKVQYLGTWTGGWNQIQFEWRTDCERGIITQREVFGDLRVAAVDDAVLTPVPVESCEAFYDDSAALLRAFVASIRDGTPVPCDGRDHLQTLAMVFAAIESSERGCRVELGDFRRRHGLMEVAVEGM